MEPQQKAQEEHELRPGTVIAGKFVIEDFLAEGAMGTVYRARQEPMGREVALKVMRRHLDRKPTAVKRFLQEAVAVSKLKHPNSITLFDFGRSDDERLYLAMELIEGKSLKQLLFEQKRLGLQRTVRIVSQVALALAEAHRQGIVHRDLKPANILLVDLDGQPDFVKVIDFGIAQLDEGVEERLTKQGASCGTPAYMSPEQLFDGRDVDRRSDLFTLGVIMYELLEGRRPYDGPDIIATIERRRSSSPDPMDDRHPSSIREFVYRLLSLDPAQRPGSVDAMLRELEAALPPGVRLHLIELRLDHRSKETVRVDVPDLDRGRETGVVEHADAASPGLQTLVHLEKLRRAADAGSEAQHAPSAAHSSDAEGVTSRGSARATHAPVIVGVASLVLGALALVLWDPLGTFAPEAPAGHSAPTSAVVENATPPAAVAPPTPVEAPPSAAPRSEASSSEAPPVAEAPAAVQSPAVDALQAAEGKPPEVRGPLAVGEPVQTARGPDEPTPTEATPPVPGGEAAACVASADCASGNCSNGRCAPDGFAFVPPGRFAMGTRGSRDDPQHEVTITRPFFLGRFETTQGEWTAVMEHLHTDNPGCGADCPAENSRWIQVVEYLNARSRAEGLEPCYVIARDRVTWPRGLDCRGYRLPTEAEWEYAARAGSTTDYRAGIGSPTARRRGVCSTSRGSARIRATGCNRPGKSHPTGSASTTSSETPGSSCGTSTARTPPSLRSTRWAPTTASTTSAVVAATRRPRRPVRRRCATPMAAPASVPRARSSSSARPQRCRAVVADSRFIPSHPLWYKRRPRSGRGAVW